MRTPEKFYDGITLGLFLLFASFWAAVGLAVWVAVVHPDKQGLFAFVSSFATGFGAAMLAVFNNSSGHKNTTITGEASTITVEQSDTPKPTDPEVKTEPKSVI